MPALVKKPSVLLSAHKSQSIPSANKLHRNTPCDTENILSWSSRLSPSLLFDVQFGGCNSTTLVRNNSWITLRIYLWSPCFALAAGWRAFESSVLVQFTIMLDTPSTETHAKAIWMLMVMLPMPDLLNASNRAFKMAAIRVVAGGLIMHTTHNALWTHDTSCLEW